MRNWYIPGISIFQNNAFEESPYRLTVKFQEQGDDSKLHVKQENLKDDESVMVHEKGWNKELENLQNYLNS